MRPRRALLTAALVTAAIGGAQATSAAAATTTPGQGPAPVAAHARLVLDGIFVVHRDAVTVPERTMALEGTVRPYAPDQWVAVRVTLGRAVLKTDRLRVKPAPGDRAGHFTEMIRSPAPGIVRMTVTHSRTPQMAGFQAARAVAALSPRAGFGSRGLFVDLVQQRLAALHIYLVATGVYDQGTGLALDAYHRLLRHGFAQSLDPGTVSELLDGRGAFRVRYPGDGRHAEGDLSLQLLALIHGSQVERIYPISSGKPSTPTVLGRYRVYARTPGYLPDGMYYSSFFTGGYAIHGYDPAPDYPASHGCMRLPIMDAISAYDWLNFGDRVDVYYQ
jgi:hypothetical protein